MDYSMGLMTINGNILWFYLTLRWEFYFHWEYKRNSFTNWWISDFELPKRKHEVLISMYKLYKLGFELDLFTH